MMVTYVYEATEVRLTGREAVREIKSPNGGKARAMVLVEITPVEDFDWKKWVMPTQLYEVRDKTD